MNPRGRLRRRRRQRPKLWTIALGVPKVAEFSARTRSRSLFLSDVFAYLRCSARSTCSKSALLFFWRHHTHGGQDFGQIEASRIPVFDLENGSTPVSSSKKWVRSEPINSLNKLFKELLRRLTRWHSLEIAPAAQLVFST